MATHRFCSAILILLAILPLLAVLPPGAKGAATDEAVPLLVKTAVPITPEVVASISYKSVKVTYVWPEIRAMAVSAKTSMIADLEANPMVARVEPDLSVAFATSPTSDAALTPVPLSTTAIQTWNQDMANTQGSGYDGAGVTVAVVDAGLPQNWQEFLPAGSVDLTHAIGFGAEGWGDFHSQVNAIHGTGGYIGLFPHGLAVSSVIVGFPSEVGSIGGAAPGARILPVRVLNQFNFGWISWFTAGILHVANLKASGALPGPVVINFSIQIHGFAPVLADAIDYAIANGVLFVTIAGNFNPNDVVSFPGRMPQSITAAAAGWTQEGSATAPWFFADVPEGDASQVYVAPFSGREPLFAPPGSQIDVLAPGSFVFGEWLFAPGFSEGHRVAFPGIDNFIFGTSFAAPHVAGIVAQMLQKNPSLTQAQAEAILRSTALSVPDVAAGFTTALGVPVLPWDTRATGAGLVQGTAAVGATPLAAATPTGSYAAAREAGERSAEGFGARVISRPGIVPAVVEWGALGQGASAGRVFDAQGRVVRHWHSESTRGTLARWDGRDDAGTAVGKGVYFLQLEATGRSAAVKVVVLGD